MGKFLCTNVFFWLIDKRYDIYLIVTQEKWFFFFNSCSQYHYPVRV